MKNDEQCHSQLFKQCLEAEGLLSDLNSLARFTLLHFILALEIPTNLFVFKEGGARVYLHIQSWRQHCNNNLGNNETGLVFHGTVMCKHNN